MVSMAGDLAGKSASQAIQQLLTAVVPPTEASAEGTTEQADMDLGVSFDENDDPVM